VSEKDQHSAEKEMHTDKDVEGHMHNMQSEPQINAERDQLAKDDEGEDVEGHMMGMNAEPNQNAMNSEPEQNA
jgi:hypothetical protein